MKLSRAFFITFLSRELTLGFSFLNAVILARCLGAEGIGTYSLVVTAANLLAQAACLGINYSNNFLAARDPSSAGKLFVQSFLPVLVLLPVAALALRLPGIGDLLFGRLDHGLQLTAWLGTGLIVLQMNVGAILFGLGRFREYSITSSVGAIGTGLSNTAVVALMGSPVSSAIRVWLAWNGVALLLTIALLLRSKLPSLSLDIRVFSASLRVGGRALINSVFGFSANRGILLLLNRSLGPAGVGAYSVVLPMAELLQHIPATLGPLLFTEASAQASSPGKVARILRLHWIVSGLGAGLLMAAAPLLLPLIFGARFTGSAEPFRILLVGHLFYGGGALVGSFVAGRRGYPVSFIAVTGLMAAIALGLSSWWIPSLGVLGAAAAWTVSSVTTSLLMIALFRQEAGAEVSFRDLFPRADDLPALWRSIVRKDAKPTDAVR